MQYEMKLLHEAGLSEVEVIKASTLIPAQFFGCADRLGTIQMGKQADLVVLSQDLTKVADAEITKTKVFQTYVAGELVYDSEKNSVKEKSVNSGKK